MKKRHARQKAQPPITPPQISEQCCPQCGALLPQPVSQLDAIAGQEQQRRAVTVALTGQHSITLELARAWPTRWPSGGLRGDGGRHSRPHCVPTLSSKLRRVVSNSAWHTGAAGAVKVMKPCSHVQERPGQVRARVTSWIARVCAYLRPPSAS